SMDLPKLYPAVFHHGLPGGGHGDSVIKPASAERWWRLIAAMKAATTLRSFEVIVFRRGAAFIISGRPRQRRGLGCERKWRPRTGPVWPCKFRPFDWSP